MPETFRSAAAIGATAILLLRLPHSTAAAEAPLEGAVGGNTLLLATGTGLASGDPVRMTGEAARALPAVSARSAFFRALPCIGNAPTVMVRAIASRRGVGMPRFASFCAWSFAPMLPRSVS